MTESQRDLAAAHAEHAERLSAVFARELGVDPEDAASEAAGVLVSCAVTYDGNRGALFSTYLSAAIRNRVIDLSRASSTRLRRARPLHEVTGGAMGLRAEADPFPDLRGVDLSAVPGLGSRYRGWLARWAAGETPTAIAAADGVPEGTVKSGLDRARALLRAAALAGVPGVLLEVGDG